MKEAKLLAETRLQRVENYFPVSGSGIEPETMGQIKALGDLLKRLNTELTLPRTDIDPQDLIDLIVNLCQAVPRRCGNEKRFIHHNFCRFVSVSCVKQRMVWSEDVLDVAIRNIFELVLMGMHLQIQDNIIESLRALSYLLNEKTLIKDTNSPSFSWDVLIKTLVSLASEGFIPSHLQGITQDDLKANEDFVYEKLKTNVNKSRERNVNIRRFACICLGNLVFKSGMTLVGDQKQIFRAIFHVFGFLAKILQANQYKHSNHPSTMTSVLKAMCNVMSEWHGVHANYLPLLCSNLRTLMLYGTHLDPRGSSNPGDSESETGDQSENERQDSGENKSSKLRVMVLSCLACIARVNTKLFHDHWLQFLPHNMNDATRKRPFGGANIITVIVHDTSSKVRLQALATLAAFFEKNNLSNIAGKLDKPQKLAFDSLSTRYARILHALHHALVQLLRQESLTSVRIQTLKTLNALVLNTIYKKLSPGLLSLVAAVAFEILQGPVQVQGNIKYSLWSLLTAVFGTSQNDVAQEELRPFLGLTAPTPEFIQQKLELTEGDQKEPRDDGTRPLPLRPVEIRSLNSSQLKPPRKCLLDILQADARKRKPEEPYPDARTVVSKLARFYRFSVTQVWHPGMRQFLINGLRNVEPSVVVETLKVVEQWIIPVSEETHLVCSRMEAVYGLFEIPEAREIIATELVKITPKFPGLDQKATTLRARVLSVLSVLRVWHWQGFTKEQRKNFLDIAYNATFDESVSVRTAGCRALGVLMTFRLEFPNYYQIACQRLIGLLENEDCSKQTQIRASWAIANICDHNVNVHHQHPEEPDPWIENSVPGFKPCLDENVRPCLVQLVTPDIVGRLIGTCFNITNKDEPKISANAIRAVGNIGHWLPLDSQEEDGSSEQVWVAICTVLSREMSKEKNTHKAKWNACYATGNVLSNPHMPRIKTPEAKRYTLELYRTLLEVLGTSENFKVRINAVQALTAPPTRKHYGAIFGSLWVMLLNCIRNLQENNNVQKYVEIKYQIVLAKKLAFAVFHMIDLCSPRDLKNAQVAALLGAHTRVLALMLVERHRELWTNEQYLSTSTTAALGRNTKPSFFGTTAEDMTTDNVVEAYEKVKTLLTSLETAEGKLHLENFILDTRYFEELKKEDGKVEEQPVVAVEEAVE